jgi:sec-independent protein translocase protein TatA
VNEEMLAMFGLPGGTEWLVIALVALLLFGRRLPEVARSLGKSIVEFKRGIRDVESDAESQSRIEPPVSPKLESSDPIQKSSSNASPEKHSEVH